VAARLREQYTQEIRPALVKEFGYRNELEAPKLEKIVINIGVGEAITNNRALDAAVGDLTAITGQKPVVTRAKKSIAAFRLREGMPIGTKVTLRGDRMYEFLDRLANASLPHSVCRSNLFSLRSSTTKSTRRAAWRFQ
jgi:large subunit ribosomal protein L5